MLALVLKTQKVVNIVEKKGDYYIDEESNPYLKKELEFFIQQNDSVSLKDEQQNAIHLLPFFDFGQFQGTNDNDIDISSYLDNATLVVTETIKAHPLWESHEVVAFVTNVMQGLISRYKKQ